MCADTGPEAVTGSTRLKAGTAAKMMLNSFSTALRVALVGLLSGVDPNAARQALDRSGGIVRAALDSLG